MNTVVVYWICPSEQRWYAHLRTTQVLQWKKRNVSAEFKRESAQLVVDQNYTVADAVKAINVGLSTMARWVKQLRDERQGKTPKVSLRTPEQIEIRELRKKIQRIEMENEMLRSWCQTPWTVLDNRETQSALSAGHTLPCVRGSSQQLQILETGLKKQTADGLYYAVRYLSYMASATVRPEQEASP